MGQGHSDHSRCDWSDVAAMSIRDVPKTVSKSSNLPFWMRIVHQARSIVVEVRSAEDLQRRRCTPQLDENRCSDDAQTDLSRNVQKPATTKTTPQIYDDEHRYAHCKCCIEQSHSDHVGCGLSGLSGFKPVSYPAHFHRRHTRP